ncbi:MAG: flagellar hook-length control protein FliK [Phenylobacterium sp.]|uniref:flagellar hook-length control protein FliK n=3 Tax=Phenylobacterium sp. TaxID=1871053 RepID=UPI0025F7D4FB|nr:flagellar hook-length control protein FliK [Phenylobacterium sp.]MCA6224390.1 flagellar hook-length control protein FliK [Phenylobacterium sp.]MCA6234486.1 flagellar hook-length control protein FliK [Phenylobacterium sp.]MCA6266084.1 flagellar hook-length control protein FliK [Phenylobacterium sp.]MCA6318728.1 flagellar hook-length control protein FliK [Phenylobacterium sp.]
MSFDVAQILAPATAGLVPGAATSTAGDGATAGDFAAVLESLASGPEAHVAATAVTPSAAAAAAFFSQTPALTVSLPEAGITVGATVIEDIPVPLAALAVMDRPSDGGRERTAGDVGKDDTDLAPSVDLILQDALPPNWIPVTPPVLAETHPLPVTTSAPAGLEAASRETQPAAFGIAESPDTATLLVTPTSGDSPRAPQADLLSTVLADVPPATPFAQDGDLATAANPAMRPETVRQGPVAQSGEPQPAASALPEGVDAVIRQVTPTPVNTARAPQADIPPAMPATQEGDLAPATIPVQRPQAARQGPVTASIELQPAAVAEGVDAVIRPVTPTPVNALQTAPTDALPAAPTALPEDVPPALPAAQDGDPPPAANPVQRPDAARQGPLPPSGEPQPAAVAEGVAPVTPSVTPTPVNTLRTARTDAPAALPEDMPAAQEDDPALAAIPVQRSEAADPGPDALSMKPPPAAVAEGVAAPPRQVTPTLSILQTAGTDAPPAAPAALPEAIPPALPAAQDSDPAPANIPVQRPELTGQALLSAGAPPEIRPAEPRRLAASGPTGREPSRTGVETEGDGILVENVGAPLVTTASLPAAPIAERPGTSPGMPRPVEVVAEEGPEALKGADLQAPLASAVFAPASAESREGPVSPARATPETIAALSAQMARRLDDGITRFNLELNPDDLGRVDVRLEIDASGGIRAAFTFERAQSAVELGRRADELQKSLESAGFNLTGGLSFDVAGDRSHGRHPSWAEARDERPNPSVTSEPDLAREGATQIADALSGRRPSSRYGVDIRI